MDFDFTGELWVWDGPAAWHFVTVPAGVSEVIRTVHGPSVRGFGSVRVAVAIGTTRWRTSVFPQSSEGTYALPVKKQVRSAEGITAGDTVEVRLELVE